MSRALWMAAVLMCALPAFAHGQQYRGELRTRLNVAELRPLRLDTVPRGTAVEVGPGDFEVDGVPVFCILEDQCVRYRAVGVEATASLTQEMSGTAWGFGVQGLSATFSLRLRERAGGEFVWPRTDDRFDWMVGYAQLDRGRIRARAGRMQNFTGLGRSAFDGLSVRYRPHDDVRVEMLGGRSLARGLNQPRNEAFQGLEDFFPDTQAWLIGGSGTWTAGPSTHVTAQYQREILGDRSALVSERASVDVRSVVSRLRVSGSADWDFAFGRVGKAHLSALTTVGTQWMLELEARRYVPYFELWTIWGFFDPVPYHEVTARMSWSPDTGLALWARGGRRSYGDAESTVIFSPLEDQSTSVELGGRWTLPTDVVLSGRYRLERGAGAYVSAGDLRVEWSAAERVRLGAHGQAFQQIEQFRLGEGTAYGGGLSVEVDLTDRFRFGAGGSFYRNAYENRPYSPDWNQRRAWSALTVRLGGDPGLRVGGAR